MLRGFSLLVLTLSAGFAQIGTSTITGRVVDASGAIVPNVAITILQKTTNFTFQAVTNEDGLYRVLSLQPGAYRITFEAGGFKKSVRDDIELRTGDTMAVDITMQVGQVSESVEAQTETGILRRSASLRAVASAVTRLLVAAVVRLLAANWRSDGIAIPARIATTAMAVSSSARE